MSATASDPLEVVQAFIAAIAVKDFDTALSYVAADCAYENMPIGPVHGPEAMRALLEPAFAPTIENEWIIRSTAVAGPVVILERLDRHHLPNGWAELPITGIFEVHDGRLTAWREYFDLATFEREFAAHA